jgi:hypothetical protein
MSQGKFDIELKPIDLKKLSVVSPQQRGYQPTAGVEEWRFSGPAGPNPYSEYREPHLFYPYKVQDNDDWGTVTARAGLESAADLIRMNFFGVDAKKDPEVVNWYLLNYVGCVHSRDGDNCSFSAAAHPGRIWLPLKKSLRWPPILKIQPWDCDVHEVQLSMLKKFNLRTSQEANLFGTNTVVRARTYLASPQGLRYIVAANSQFFLFVLVQASSPKHTPFVGKLLIQPNGLLCGRSDVEAGLWQDVAARGASLRAAAEWEMEILIGLLAGAGKAVQVGIATARAIDFLLTDKVRKYELHGKALKVVLEEMYHLRQTSPLLFDLFIGGLFAEAKKQLGANLGAGASSPGVVVGWLIGEVGPDVLAGRLEALKYAAAAMKKIAGEFSKNLGKAAEDKALADFKTDRAAFVQRLQKAGIPYSPGTEDELLAEIAKNPNAIGNALGRIEAAFAAVQ